ncbi:Ssu72-like protein [Basidiobolus meristosporus CBS 931.73]|uniref:RNA polymerase II subunit A C-terminal domain phosphatase SSU72 n=1 Tax=Basidiobolus meristosporus CBS 931.73 TaxID=1314790 RepID=A0A1Y1YFT2_9FUNG|nr:Ssu72-like protein [Basidiobolus meristosporus CBS 931.73]|eukprot:ORX96872.1 Ssu72-like protein [Basidiobolus meristosporus CBS 931.73]
MTKFAVICASNQNRSMEAHHVLQKKGFNISSFGTGSAVRLPGSAIDKPNIYQFGTPYDTIYNELKGKDFNLYTQNGLLNMLDRNRKIKRAPERFQESKGTYDVIFTCEERCYDAVCEELAARGGRYNRPVHVINVEIKDNHEDAAIGGRWILQLATMIDQAKDFEEEMENILLSFSSKSPLHILHTIAFY